MLTNLLSNRSPLLWLSLALVCAITPPLAAKRYGTAMRIICVRKEIGFMRSLVSEPDAELVSLQAPTSQRR